MGGRDVDLRLTYCTFVISALLNDWPGVNAEKKKSMGFTISRGMWTWGTVKSYRLPQKQGEWAAGWEPVD